MDRTKLSALEGYARWAPRYDGYTNSLILIEERFVPPLFGEVAGKRIVDVACGTGRHAIRLHERGAQVVGVDPSPEMLAILRAKCPELDVREGTATALPVESGAFDIALSALLMEHLPDVRPALAEMVRALGPGGALVMSVYHPWFLLKGVPPHFREDDGAEYELPWHVHLPATYFTALTELGMRVTHMLEPAVDDVLLAQLPKMVKHAGLPHALIIRAEKPAVP